MVDGRGHVMMVYQFHTSQITHRKSPITQITNHRNHQTPIATHQSQSTPITQITNHIILRLLPTQLYPITIIIMC